MIKDINYKSSLTLGCSFRQNRQKVGKILQWKLKILSRSSKSFRSSHKSFKSNTADAPKTKQKIKINFSSNLKQCSNQQQQQEHTRTMELITRQSYWIYLLNNITKYVFLFWHTKSFIFHPPFFCCAMLSNVTSHYKFKYLYLKV